MRQKLFFDKDLESFAVKFAENYFSHEFFSSLCKREYYADLMPSFIANASLGIIRRWKDKPADKRVSLDELADDTAKLLMTGLNGLKER